MSTANIKKFVVFTATGDQGSSVCRYLVKDGYHVIGLTRNPESAKAKALSEIGVHMSKADLDDPASYAAALEGVYGAYVNADFWARYFANGNDGRDAGEYESGQSKAAIEACVKAGAKHIVFSTLDATGDLVPHMDYKQAVTQWAAERSYPVTNLYTSHYISNFVKFKYLSKQPDGSFTLTIPAPDDCPLINFAVEQTGGWVAAVLRDPKKYIGQRVDACSEVVTVAEWAAAAAEVSGKTIRTLNIPGGEAYIDGTEVKKMVPVEELYLNYLAFYKKLCPRDIKASKEVYPEQWDTKAWIRQCDEVKAILGM